jgi:CP family cyanate transporter-like MFS transporter
MLGALGLVGLMVYPGWATVWVVLFGLGMSAALILSLAFAGLRATNLQQAATLSAMSQCVGYLLAAGGPALAGVVHDASGNWNLPLGGCVALCVIMANIGLIVGRDTRIQ